MMSLLLACLVLSEQQALLGLCCQAGRECSGDRACRHPVNLAASRSSTGGPAGLGSLAGRLCLGGRSVHSQVQQILLPLQQLVAGRASPATRCQEVPPSTASIGFHTNCKLNSKGHQIGLTSDLIGD